MEKMEYDDWFDTYKPIKNDVATYEAAHEGMMFETYGAERERIVKQIDVDERCIWTLVEGDNGEWIVISGYHWVNRLGYFITEVPFKGEYMEVMYAEAEPDDDRDPCDRPNGEPHAGPWVSDTEGGSLYCKSCGMWQDINP